jgi:uncharacterized membrane protein YvlD (DUF360 family)
MWDWVYVAWPMFCSDLLVLVETLIYAFWLREFCWCCYCCWFTYWYLVFMCINGLAYLWYALIHWYQWGEAVPPLCCLVWFCWYSPETVILYVLLSAACCSVLNYWMSCCLCLILVPLSVFLLLVGCLCCLLSIACTCCLGRSWSVYWAALWVSISLSFWFGVGLLNCG